MPREAHGTVVQLADSTSPPDFPDRAALLDHLRTHGADGNPRWWVDPLPPEGDPFILRAVVLRTPSLAAALGFFAGLLGGSVRADLGDRVDLEWPGGAAIALEERRDALPGVDRLELVGLDREVEVLGTRFAPAR